MTGMTFPYLEGTAYLVLKPGRYPYSVTVDKATNKRPTATPEGSIVVRFALRVPKAAFEPLDPKVELTVPEELVQHIVEAQAEPEPPPKDQLELF